jgi:hypothetical protein
VIDVPNLGNSAVVRRLLWLFVDNLPRTRVAIRCSAILSAAVAASIAVAWACPRYAFGYPDDVVAAGLSALGSFALAASAANCVFAAIVFWRAPETRSAWLNAAIVMPAFVVLLYPAIQA